MEIPANLTDGDYYVRLWLAPASVGLNANLYDKNRAINFAPKQSKVGNHMDIVEEIIKWLRADCHNNLAIAYRLYQVTVGLRKINGEYKLYSQPTTAQTFIYESLLAVPVVKIGNKEILTLNRKTKISLSPEVQYKPVSKINCFTQS